MKFRAISLFAGLGGFDIGLEATGHFRTVAFCEIDSYARSILKNNWPEVPIYEDVRTITRRQLVDDGVHGNCIVGGFPCQDASAANVFGEGTDGERTGLFREMCRLASEIQPDFMLMENVPNLLNRGFGDVLGRLAEIGFDAEWECISARDVGANHERERLWIMAYPRCEGWQGSEPYKGVLGRAKASLTKYRDPSIGRWRPLVSDLMRNRTSDGLSIAMERRRIHALGNAVVPKIPEMIGHAIWASVR